MADITLFHCPQTRSQGTLWLLEELGVEYDIKVVNVMKGEGLKPEYLKVNPSGKVPAINYKGQVVTELAAISIFLCDLFPDAGLAPAIDAPDRGEYLKWSVFRPGVLEPAMIAKTRGWEVERGMVGWGSWEIVVEQLEDHLKDRTWFLGDTFSAADILTGGGVGWMRMFGIIGEHEIFDRYIGQIREREAFLKVQEIDAKLKSEMEA